MDAELVKALATVIAALLSAVFGIASWVALREIRKREKAERDLKEDLQNAVVKLSQDVEKEQKERIRIDEQLFSKVNAINQSAADLGNILSSHQKGCMEAYMTRQEYDRMETLKERIEDQRKEQDRRMDQNIQNVTNLLHALIRKNGRG